MCSQQTLTHPSIISIKNLSKTDNFSKLSETNRPYYIQCCQPWDFIPRSWDFLGIFILGIRPWDFSWDFLEYREDNLNVNVVILINLLAQ